MHTHAKLRIHSNHDSTHTGSTHTDPNRRSVGWTLWLIVFAILCVGGVGGAMAQDLDTSHDLEANQTFDTEWQDWQDPALGPPVEIDPAALGGEAWWRAAEPGLLPTLTTKVLNASVATIDEPEGVEWSAIVGDDFDGDGFGDVALGSGSGGGIDGVVYIFYSPGGVLSTTPGTVLTGDAATRFGQNMSAPGDVNGDGFADLVAHTSRQTPTVYVFHGGPAGIASGAASTVAAVGLLNSPRKSFRIGDVNGDGIDDLAVSEAFNSSCGCQRVSVGRLRIYYGSATGLEATNNTLHSYPDIDSRCNCTKIGGFTCSTRVCSYGFKTVGGDFDNDGINDVVALAEGYNRDGKFYLYKGVVGDLPSTPDASYFNLDNERPSVASGDFDSDGFDDLAFVSANLDTIRVFEGSSAGIDDVSDLTITAPLDAGGDSGTLRRPNAGDFNGDGYLDLLVSAETFDFPGANAAGAVYVYPGSPAGLDATLLETLEGEAQNAKLGRRTAVLGDIDGDLVTDYGVTGFKVVAGAATSTGEAQIFLGVPGADPDLVLDGGLDEGSGTTTTAGGVTGDLVGGATWGLGQQGAAIELDGSGYVLFEDDGSGSVFDLETAATLVVWVRPEALGGHQTVLSKDEAYELEFGKLGDSTWNVRLNNEVQGTASTPIQEGIWQQLAITWDGTTVRYYTNGAPDGSDPFAGPLTLNDTDLGIGARPGSLAVGGPTFYFEGGIDGVLVFERALSDMEIADLFTNTVTDIAAPVRSNVTPDAVVATSPVAFGFETDEAATCRWDEAAEVRYADMTHEVATTGGTSHADSFNAVAESTLLQARCRDALGNTNTVDLSIGIGLGSSDISTALQADWLFEEGSGCTTENSVTAEVADLSNTNGTCDATDNSPQWQANVADAVPGPCFSGSCLAFDGDDKVSVDVGDAVRVNPQEVTVAAWIRHEAIQTGNFSVFADLRGNDVDSGFLVGWVLALNGDGQGYFRVRGTTTETTTEIDDGAWHQLVGVWKRNPDGTGFTEIYIDGALAVTGGAAGSFNLPATTQLQIGHRFNADETLHNFKGELDTLSVYDRALTSLEIFDLYLATRP